MQVSHLLRATVLVSTVATASGCRTGSNYTSTAGPRYSGGAVVDPAPRELHGDTLTIVTFNIENGKRVDSALVVLRTAPELNDPDLVMLQEVDEPGTQRIAQALGMWYVYYPAALRDNTKREWGNSVLSRWPVLEDQKLVLPHIGRWAKTMRAATAATIRFGNVPLRVYSAHLGTIWNVGSGGRRDQLRAILSDAARFDRVIIAGDMNSASVGEIAAQAGYAWPTRHVAKTITFGRYDHVFLKGLVLPESAAVTVQNNHHASDHKPVRVRAVLRQDSTRS